MQTFRAVIVLAYLSAGLTAHAETLSLAEANYKEAFTGSAPVSGRVLTGLAYGRAGEHFNTGALRLGLGAERGAGFVCVRVQSQDGLYWSENAYLLPERGEAAPSLEIRTSFAEQLARYRVGQIGIRALAARDCAAADGALVPALTTAPADLTRLSFQLNVSGRRPEARLLPVAGAPLSAACVSLKDSAAVAFNYACDIALPPDLPDDTYRLEVTLRGMTGARTVEHFEVMIARGGLHGS
ncbi:MAG: hypothetical protein PHS60_05875 [Zavarzinia sp.]|nr:hypothetical protein [Zavarzinia sp.]